MLLPFLIITFFLTKIPLGHVGNFFTKKEKNTWPLEPNSKFGQRDQYLFLIWCVLAFHIESWFIEFFHGNFLLYLFSLVRSLAILAFKTYCRCQIRTTQICCEWADQLDSRRLTLQRIHSTICAQRFNVNHVYYSVILFHIFHHVNFYAFPFAFTLDCS